MQILSGLVNAKNILEIGSLFGYSASFLLDSLPEDGVLVVAEKDPEHAAYIKAALGADKKLKLLIGDGLEMMEEISMFAPYDLIFIDANKAAYQKYFMSLDPVLRPRGLMVFDNVLFKGLVYEGEAGRLAKKIDDFNRFIAKQKHYQSVIIPSVDGILIARKLSS